MSEQRTLSSVAYDSKRKVTRRERFLQEMNAVIPWATLEALVAPHYPTAGRGRRPLPLATMLRVYFLQQWFDLSDPQAEDMRYDSEAMRRFAEVDLLDDRVPDETIILRFRHLLEQHQLTAQMFAAVKELLEAKRSLLKAGTIVDATIIAAPSAYFADADHLFRPKAISRFAPCRSPVPVDADQGVTWGSGRVVSQQWSRRDRAWRGGGASRR